MQYAAGVRQTVAAVVAAVATTVLVAGCTPSGEDGAQPAEPSRSAQSPTPGAATGGSGGAASATPAAPGSPTAAGGGAKPCTVKEVKATEARQAAVRPPGTGTGAAVIAVANTSKSTCTLQGFPTVAGAGNGSPDKNMPLATTHSGAATTVSLAPGAKAWTKLTFVNVQGEADGYCVSGATPASFPTLVVGVPGAGAHQIALDDGIFALCDNKATVTAYSAAKPS
ncbi:DUF4232 domain-containing protein [Streptomyces sp. BR123]|uniref:DUF4232 domain-containing protein n=1 Tax=Streptomyces sp. BR123 TaxID=2749828 RepID=UPI0015C4A4BA|nr:DUF4232 domain-containing protein [Streptomyces sp. BR123]NXY96566.1 DUF4232 domain-containing protein [Streptomyces sp. BR123]